MGYFSDQKGGGGEGIASAKLKDVGDMVAGTIVGTKFVGVTDYKTQQPIIDPGTGQQEQQLRIDIELMNGPDNYASASKPLTDEETRQELPDSGRRAIYVRKNTNISFAIARALEAVGLDDVRVGDKIWVRHSSTGTTRSGTQFKEHEAGYQLAPQQSGFDGFQQAQQTSPAATQQQAPPPAQQQGAYDPRQAYAQPGPAQQQAFQGYQPGPAQLAGQPNPMAAPPAQQGPPPAQPGPAPAQAQPTPPPAQNQPPF